MIITISGKSGSGKSTVARIVAKKLGLKHYSIGDLWRKMAAERNMTILQFNKLSEKDPNVDLETDKRQQELGKKEDNFVIDGRMSFHFIPNSVKIFLDVDDGVGADRIFQQKRGDVENYPDIEETMERLWRREQSELKRYRKLYKTDYTNTKNFDAVIDTTKIPADKVADRVLQAVNMIKEAKRKQNL